MADGPQGQEYTGGVAEMRDSPWLASEDIDGAGDVPVTISRVMRYKDVPFQDGRKKPNVFALEFVGKARQMVVNATNRKTLSGEFGKPENWKGKSVLLYVQDGVKNPAGGATVKGLRIRIPSTSPSSEPTGSQRTAQGELI